MSATSVVSHLRALLVLPATLALLAVAGWSPIEGEALAAEADGRAAVAPAGGEIVKCEGAEYEKRLASRDVFVAWFPAVWCPTCKKQGAALKSLVEKGLANNPLICSFDFDETEALQEKLGVSRQSVLVLYAKGKEKARSMGETNPERLEKFILGQ